MRARDGLSAPVRALFMDLVNAGELPQSTGTAHDVQGEAGGIGEGTWVRFSLQMSDGQVLRARYRAYGCPYTLATCEWLARQLVGKALAGGDPAADLTAAVGIASQWATALQVPAERLGRLLVVEDALRTALQAARTALPAAQRRARP